MTASAKLAALEAERQAAKARLESTFTLLKARSAPGAIAARAVDDARAKAAESGQRAADVARENPAAVGGLAAVFASILAVTFVRGRRKRRRAAAPVPATAKTSSTRDANRVTI